VRLMHKDMRLSSIRQINALPIKVRHAIYASLVPRHVLAAHDLDGEPLFDRLTIQIRCPERAGVVEIDARHPLDQRDPVMYVQLADTAYGQLEVLLMVVNDPTAPRFDTDRNWRGESTKLGTRGRNIPAEVEAMRAGLAPGQVRRGLRLSRDLVPIMDRFAAGLGKDRFFIEPLTYHNAIQFEKHGFAYVTGLHKMQEIHSGFQPGFPLWRALDGSTPFRQRGAERTVRGRSWAIHDGILGEPWAGVRMYKRVGEDAHVCTFPDAVY